MPTPKPSMRATAGLALTFALGLAAVAGAATPTSEVTIVSGLKGPEGPLYLDGNLYYVGWVSGTLSRWDGTRSVVLNDQKGCGHNGLALTPRKTFLLACTDDPGAILELDLNGKVLRRWSADRAGRPFKGGINDVVVAPSGAAYATLWGPATDNPTAVIGGIVYLGPGAKDWVQVADGLNYANGVGVSPDEKTLYVSETVGNMIQTFTINSDGTLRDRSNFALLSLLTDSKARSWWLGPDSMKVDAKGNIYVAQWFGGKILKLSPEGRLLHQFDIRAGGGTTNLAFGERGEFLYVTVVADPNDPDAKGGIVKIPNVK